MSIIWPIWFQLLAFFCSIFSMMLFALPNKVLQIRRFIMPTMSSIDSWQLCREGVKDGDTPSQGSPFAWQHIVPVSLCFLFTLAFIKSGFANQALYHAHYVLHRLMAALSRGRERWRYAFPGISICLAAHCSCESLFFIHLGVYHNIYFPR